MNQSFVTAGGGGGGVIGRAAPGERGPGAPVRGVFGPISGAHFNPVVSMVFALRRELSREEGVPAFMIFPDKTLLQMAEERPMTLSELGRIHGVGQRKLSLYGEAFLEILLGG